MPRSFLPTLMQGLFIVLLLMSPGCAQQAATTSNDVKIFQTGSLSVSKNDDVPASVYITARGSDSPHLTQYLEKNLSRAGFRIADSPSKAGYIIHVSLVQEGSVNPALFQKMVDMGYGGEARFSGTGAAGIIMDALLVQRRVPQSRRPSRVRLKNISARNALDDSQMRVGLLMEKPSGDSADIRQLFLKKIAAEIAKSMTSTGINTASAE